MERPDKKGGHQIPQQAAKNQQSNTGQSVPAGDGPDRLGLVGLLDNVDDVGPPDGPHPHVKQHKDNKQGEGQGQGVGRRIEGQAHFLRVHHAHPEDLPQQPGQRSPQSRPQGAGPQAYGRQFTGLSGPELPPGGSQSQEDTGFAGFLPEEQAGGVGGEHTAPQHGQDENHHNLFPAVAPLRQNVQNSGRAHHAHIGRNQQDGEKAAACQQRVLPPVLPPQSGIDF